MGKSGHQGIGGMLVSESGKKFPVAGGVHILSPMFCPRESGTANVIAPTITIIANRFLFFIHPSEFRTLICLHFSCRASEREEYGEFDSNWLPDCVKLTHFAWASRSAGETMSVVRLVCIGSFPFNRFRVLALHIVRSALRN